MSVPSGSDLRRRPPLDEAGERFAHHLASSQTRRSFIGTVGALLLGATAERAVGGAKRPIPGTERIAGGWHGFCGHYFTTGSCRGPFKLPRVDGEGKPLRPTDGRPVDDRGRLINDRGQPVDGAGNPLVGADGVYAAPSPRTRLCEDGVRRRHGHKDAVMQGSWYRCCNGQIRKVWDCCSANPRRINGDTSLQGYCHGKRKVFCAVYVETGIPC